MREFNRPETVVVILATQGYRSSGHVCSPALTSVVAIILGVAGFNAALLSNMTTMFESGKGNAEMQYETCRQVEETAA